jgi:hypothetical protein
MSPRPSFRLAALTLAALAGCSPTFNWREVPIGDDGVVVLLPCKPDRASRRIPLGSEAVPVDMVGCAAGGATFAVARATAADPAQADSWMKAWRAATREQLGAAPVIETSVVLPRAAESPAPARLDTSGQDSHGQSGTMHVLWFARQGAGGTALYQATVLGKPSSAEALTTFFEGVRMP